jgi:Putative metallopeptidase
VAQTTEGASGQLRRGLQQCRVLLGSALKPHRRAPGEPKTKISVVYGSAEGRAAVARQVARSIQLLETVAEHEADEFVWPAPFTLEMKSCGFPNASWNLPNHKLTLCYELATDFAHLYREYGNTKANGTRLAHSVRRNTGRSTTSKSSSQSTHRKRKLGHEASSLSSVQHPNSRPPGDHIPTGNTEYLGSPGMPAIPGSQGSSFLLTRLYSPSGDLSFLLTRHQPAIGRHNLNEAG